MCVLLLYLSLLSLLSICLNLAQKIVQSEKALCLINSNTKKKGKKHGKNLTKLPSTKK